MNTEPRVLHLFDATSRETKRTLSQAKKDFKVRYFYEVGYVIEERKDALVWGNLYSKKHDSFGKVTIIPKVNYKLIDEVKDFEIVNVKVKQPNEIRGPLLNQPELLKKYGTDTKELCGFLIDESKTQLTLASHIYSKSSKGYSFGTVIVIPKALLIK